MSGFKLGIYSYCINMKYCVYTRCFFENPYIAYFIKHYIDLGFDKIIILHSGGDPYEVLPLYKDCVEIHYVKNTGNELLNTHFHLIHEMFDWVLGVDIDELLLLNASYKSIHDYVQKKNKSKS